jgi:hypothetical protein
VHELHAEQTQLEMQLVVARVAAAAPVASKASAWTSLEVARQSAEDRATTAETAAATAATEQDSLASRLAQRRPLKGPILLRPLPRPPPGTPPRPPLTRRRCLRRGCRSWSVILARPRRTWRRRAANSPRLRTSSRWSPRRRRSCTTTMPSCRRILKVSHEVPSLVHLAHCMLHITP